jgi:hypothetical protein
MPPTDGFVSRRQTMRIASQNPCAALAWFAFVLITARLPAA